jgi:pimeloyl-ACP methyl ester carboxylesterase
MKRRRSKGTILLSSICIAALLFTITILSAGVFCTQAHAQTYTTKFVTMPGSGPGLIYQPTAPGPKSHIAILVMHPSNTSLQHPLIAGLPAGTGGLAAKGYTLLGMNSTMSSDDIVDFDKLMLQVGNGVKYLKSLPGVTKVVLLGHSGGGPTMAGYQSIAENGPAVCQGVEKIVPCPSSFAGMPAADGLLLVDSVLGMGAQTLVSMDPAVANEDSGTILLPALDMFNQTNGFHPPTGATYGNQFIERYAAAQAKRMAELIRAAQGRLAKINAGQGKYLDDEPFNIPGGSISGQATLQIWSLDLNLWAHTRDKQQLVHKDGSISNQIVPSIRTVASATSSPTLRTGAARLTTVKKFLNTWACRTTKDYGYGPDYVSGIDWQSTYNNSPGAVEKIKGPLLVVGMSASSLVVSQETIFKNAASKDKALVYIEGATHMTTPVNGNYGNTNATTVNYIDSWLSQKF